MFQNKTKNKKRIWEIDFIRGAALLFMIYFHTVYDLKVFYGFNVNFDEGLNLIIKTISASPFILVSGISSSLSRDSFKRGVKLAAVAIAITIATFLFDRSLTIKFGILHLLAICMIMYPIMKKLNQNLLIVIAAIVFIVGNIFASLTVNFEFLFPFGLKSANFTSSDYFPIFPWAGFFVAGIALAKMLYPYKRSLIKRPLPDNPANFAGRHSLVVYLAHQPIILGVLMLLDFMHII